MGISGLIPFLEKASTPVNINILHGSSVAVDSYCWLHKGVFACAEKIIRGEKTDIHIQYCLKYVDMLLRHKINVIMVFDGRHLPAKAETERKRRELRKESKQLAKEYLRNNEIEKARSYMRRAVDVTHEMALELIKACRDRGVDCIVAPYEADAQMAWLNKQGLAEYVITEDSDLTLFGAKKILFKLDLTGQALLVENTKLYLAMGCKAEKYTFDKFRRMCILSGCDYLQSLQGIGLKKACKFILTTAEDDMTKALKKLPSYLKMRQLQVTDEYIESFLKAEATFKHMFVYNPLLNQMERLHELEEFQTDECLCSNAGSLLTEKEQAFQLALGNLDPFTLRKVDDWHPSKIWSQSNPKNTKSIWLASTCFVGEKETNDDKKVSRGQMAPIFHFKKIEFKNATETEIANNILLERNKLEESEIFSMYKNASPEVERKRKRQQSSSSSEDEVEQSRNETPKKSIYNPFAKVNDSLEDIQKSPVCSNSSLLKLLSPKKVNDKHINEQSIATKKSIKSRFFAENIKQVTKKPFAARDLTSDMFKIEKKANEVFKQQQDFYVCSPKKCNGGMAQKTNESEKFTTKESGTPTEPAILSDTESQNSFEKDKITETEVLKEEIVLVSDTDEEQFSQTSSSLSTLQKFTKNLQKPKLNLTKAPPKTQSISLKQSKTMEISDSKQSRLSMFGFQKKPLLRKL